MHIFYSKEVIAKFFRFYFSLLIDGEMGMWWVGRHPNGNKGRWESLYNVMHQESNISINRQAKFIPPIVFSKKMYQHLINVWIKAV